MSRGAIPRTTLLAFRLLVSMLIAIQGWYRLLHGGSPPFGDWLASQGIPLPHAIAWSITIGEIIGSACLAIGVCVPPSALLFTAVYPMAVMLIHRA